LADESQRLLGNGTEALQETLGQVRDAYIQFQAASDTVRADATELTHQMAGQFDERFEQLASALGALEKSVWQMHTVVAPIEEKLAETSSSLLSTTTAITELRQEIRRQPVELASQIRKSLARRNGLLIGLAVATGLSLAGIALILWRLLGNAM